MKMDKRKLHNELTKALTPEFATVCMGTTNGIRWCKNDPQMIDYDYLDAMKASLADNDDIFISDFTNQSARVVMKVDDFYVVFNLGDAFSVIENASPSFRNTLNQSGQTKVVQYYSAINQAYVEAMKP